MNRLLALLASCMAFGLVPATSTAHHSFAVNFDITGSTEIHGVVTDVRIRNPHSIIEMAIDATNGETEEWVVETHSVPLLRRVGINRNTFVVGEELTVRGMPSRIAGRPLIFGLEFIKSDGSSYVWRPDSLVPEGGLSAAELSSLRGGTERFEGVWGYEADPNPHIFADSPLPLTQAGLDARAAFDPFDTSAMRCIPPNVPGILYVPYLYGIQIEDDTVHLQHEYFAVTRTVPLDGEPVETESTGMFGKASARLEGDALIIESSGFPDLEAGMATSFDPNGVGADVPSSDQKRFTERYTVSDDGQILTIDYTIVDPAYLTEPYYGRTQMRRWAEGTRIEGFECDAAIASQSSSQQIE